MLVGWEVRIRAFHIIPHLTGNSMKKLKLDLDRIQVESFKVEAAKSDRGTVQAHSADPGFACGSHDSCNSNWPNYCFPVPISYESNC